ncbi:MAG: redoxin domain-containing protein [Gammaproteobacteria bacterium]|nr:redoxin domain-containing protein [Gammaproteobacteria bacterium]
MLQRSIFFGLILFASFSVTAAQEVNVFKSGSYAQFLEQHKDQSFLLVLWSLDCPPCYKELAMLAEETKNQPQLNLILVSTDTTDDIKEIQQRLNQFGFSQSNAWVFENSMAQQLRYEIDPGWYGELPRSYLFDAQHRRQAISGILRPQILQRWSALRSDIADQ